MKTCVKCLREKPLTEFTIRRDRGEGARMARCKTCKGEQVKAWTEARNADPEKFKAWKDHRQEYFNTTVSGAMHRKYRRMMLAIKRGRNVECTITIPDLVMMFREQGGICPTTGWAMTFPDGTMRPDAVSIDRIDATKGYHLGNVRLVAWQANSALGPWGDIQLHKFCKSVVERNG